MSLIPVAGSPFTQFVRLKLNFTYRDGGWTEVYNTTSTSFTDCINKWGQAIAWRGDCLAYGFTIAGASMTMIGAKGIGYPFNIVQSYSYGQRLSLDGGAFNVANAGCDDDNTSLLVRFDTGQGLFSNHWVRGIRDSWVTDDLIQITMPTDYAATSTPGPDPFVNPLTQVFPYGGSDGAYNLGTTGATYASSSYYPGVAGGYLNTVGMLNSWLSIMRDFTYLYKKIPNTNTYNAYAYGANGGNWYYRRVSERTAGRRYAFSKAKQANFA